MLLSTCKITEYNQVLARLPSLTKFSQDYQVLPRSCKITKFYQDLARLPSSTKLLPDYQVLPSPDDTIIRNISSDDFYLGAVPILRKVQQVDLFSKIPAPRNILRHQKYAELL